MKTENNKNICELVLCTLVIAAAATEQLVHDKPAGIVTFTPFWVPVAAAMISIAGIIRLNDQYRWSGIQKWLHRTGIFLMVWAANGLPLDLLRLTPLMPKGIDWPGMITRILAITAAFMLTRRLALQRPAGNTPCSKTWYGYAAFLLALPYPVLRTIWALGGTPGLTEPGAAGHGFIPWLASIPWLMAAALSLLLVSTPRWMPRKLLLASGWFATAMVAMIGPAACWSLVNGLITGRDFGLETIALWVPCLFYGSWLLWAIAAGAATRSYQLQSSRPS